MKTATSGRYSGMSYTVTDTGDIVDSEGRPYEGYVFPQFQRIADERAAKHARQSSRVLVVKNNKCSWRYTEEQRP